MPSGDQRQPSSFWAFNSRIEGFLDSLYRQLCLLSKENRIHPGISRIPALHTLDHGVEDDRFLPQASRDGRYARLPSFSNLSWSSSASFVCSAFHSCLRCHYASTSRQGKQQSLFNVYCLQLISAFLMEKREAWQNSQ